jgi:ABC-type glycerol-3-phosphate transport system substrate-binding protein
VKRALLIGMALAICLGLPAFASALSEPNCLYSPAEDAGIVLSEPIILRQGVRQSLPFEIQKPGQYALLFSYKPVNAGIFDNLVLLEMGDARFDTPLPFLWQDARGDTQVDAYGNELLPRRELYEGVSQAYAQDYAASSRRAYAFDLDAGRHTLSLTARSQDISLVSIWATPVSTPPTYQAYLAQFEGAALTDRLIILEAERYAYKNDPFIRGAPINNTALHPFEATARRINAIADASFRMPGQQVIYRFDVPCPGLYALAFAYCQPVKPGMPVYYDVLIDGRTPHQGLLNIAFPYTGLNVYRLFPDGGQKQVYVYLTEGPHTLSLAATAAPVEQLGLRLRSLIRQMNQTTLSVKKLTGQNSDLAGAIDTNRTWNITEYLPGILSDLQSWQDELSDVYQHLRTLSGREPAFAADLLLAAGNLRKLGEDPRKLPGRISLLSDDASSAAQLTAAVLARLDEQNLSLDRIYLYDGKQELPSPEESLPAKAQVELAQFLHSFSPEMNQADTSSGQVLQVWVNKPSQYVEVMKDLAIRGFTADTGIRVAFSIMPNEDKLILANASGTHPDLVLGTSIGLPFNFAVRGIARNLLEYDDFWDWYGREFNLESLVPYAYQDGIYAACETLDFKVLFYREDILSSLGLEVPDTMDQVRAMMPALHRNAMNFSLPLSSDREGYKGFQQTTPFIYQNGGDVYSKDGTRVTLRDPRTIAGIREMTDLYQKDGLLLNVRSFFNAFRTGTIPLGISDYATYILLQTTAPELTGLWNIALAPGTPDGTGQVLRYQAAVDSGVMLMQNAAMPEAAYAFMKWWLSAPTQLEYATELQLKFGPTYKWNTANLAAFEQMAYPEAHKQVILSMWRDWQKETQRHIAVYMVERELSNLWGAVARDGKELLPAIDAAEAEINREMQRKLIEFGYLDKDGSVLVPYINNAVESLMESRKQP